MGEVTKFLEYRMARRVHAWMSFSVLEPRLLALVEVSVVPNLLSTLAAGILQGRKSVNTNSPGAGSEALSIGRSRVHAFMAPLRIRRESR